MPSFQERKSQLSTMDPADFEALGHRLVRASYPTAESSGNPDSGADTLLPRPGLAGWTRAWQARRYSAGPRWKGCEEALDAAIAEWRVEHYTFIFVADLTGPQLTKFDSRLRGRHRGVTVDWWGMAELLAQLDETPDGRRVAHHFLGETKEEVDEKWREAVALGGGEVSGASDVLGRLRAMGGWLSRQDHIGYAHHSWEPWQTEPAIAPETFLAFMEIEAEDGRRTRLDAAARPDAPRDEPLAKLRLEFTPNAEGERAAQAFKRAELRGESIAFDSGVRVTWEVLPDLFSEYIGEPIEGRVEMHPLHPRPCKWRAELVNAAGESVSEIELHLIEVSGYELAWKGNLAGLELTIALRRLQRGGETRLDANFKLTAEHPIADQLDAARIMQALDQPGTLVVSVGEPAEAALSLQIEGRAEGEDEQLAGVALTLANLVVIEGWTGERLNAPEKLKPAEARDIALAAHGIRHGGFPASILGDILWDDTPEARGGLEQAGVLRFQQTFGFHFLGRDVWLGYLDYAVDDYEVVDAERHPGKLLIKPRGKDGQTLYGRLRRGDREDEPVEAPFTRLPGTGGSERDAQS